MRRIVIIVCILAASAAGTLSLADAWVRNSYQMKLVNAPLRARSALRSERKARQYRLIVIPTLGGRESYHGGGANSSGTVAGGADTKRHERRAFLCWPDSDHSTRSREIVALPKIAGSTSDRALAINDKGLVAGYANLNGGERAVYWKVKQKELRMSAHWIPKDPAYANAVVVGLNSQGGMVGRLYARPSASSDWKTNPSIAFYWEELLPSPLLLPSPSGVEVGGALAINDNGIVAGWTIGLDGQVVAASWTITKQTSGSIERQNTFRVAGRLLLRLEGGRTSRATAVNREGVIVGACGGAQSFSLWGHSEQEDEHAVAWREGVIHDLGRPLGSKSCRATAINSKGVIVGEYRKGGGEHSLGHRHGFVWDGVHGMHDLREMIWPRTDWIVEGALSINDREEILAYGVAPPNKGGFVRLFLLVPDSSS